MSGVVPLRACLDRDLVGGKAINLAKLLVAGFIVPDGVVITTEAFNRARAADGGFPQEVPPDLACEVEQAYRALGEPVVAVRSSATAEDLADASLAG